MKISTKTLYGLRAMADLAENFKGDPVLVKDIARRQNISDKYLEQILLTLKKAGVVSSISGAKGGYLLTRNPAEITALEIVEPLEGSLSPVPCLDHENLCERTKSCSTYKLWLRIKKAAHAILAETTLKDLAENKNKKEFFYQI